MDGCRLRRHVTVISSRLNFSGRSQFNRERAICALRASITPHSHLRSSPPNSVTNTLWLTIRPMISVTGDIERSRWALITKTWLSVHDEDTGYRIKTGFPCPDNQRIYLEIISGCIMPHYLAPLYFYIALCPLPEIESQSRLNKKDFL